MILEHNCYKKQLICRAKVKSEAWKKNVSGYQWKVVTLEEIMTFHGILHDAVPTNW
jgi:hypothetical protein